MSVEYSASECSETTTDVGTSDIIDLISECGECQIESMTLVQLAQLRSRLNANTTLVEKWSLERERQEATERSQQSHEICQACKLIKDPRQRKVAEIRQLHLQILNNKPADLLCTPGIFSRLEEMALDGRLDAVVAGGARCPKCRQAHESSSSSSLTSEMMDILKQELTSTPQPHCCFKNACSKCLNFVISSLQGDKASLGDTSNDLKQILSEFKKTQEHLSRLSVNIQTKTSEILSSRHLPMKNCNDVKINQKIKITRILNAFSDEYCGYEMYDTDNCLMYDGDI